MSSMLISIHLFISRCEAVIYTVWREATEEIYPGIGRKVLQICAKCLQNTKLCMFDCLMFRPAREGAGEDTPRWRRQTHWHQPGGASSISSAKLC